MLVVQWMALESLRGQSTELMELTAAELAGVSLGRADFLATRASEELGEIDMGQGVLGVAKVKHFLSHYSLRRGREFDHREGLIRDDLCCGRRE